MSPGSDPVDTLLQRFEYHQQATIGLLDAIGAEEYQQQFHPDLSPIGWHVGHCVFVETYWLQQVWLQYQTCPEGLTALYLPEQSNKSSRGLRLPGFDELRDWAASTQASNLTLLKQNLTSRHRLMQDYFLIAFLNQHYAQHYETMQMVLQQKSLQQVVAEYQPGVELQSNNVSPEPVTIEKYSHAIGASPQQTHYYDNELPCHAVELERFAIARQPVSNGDYLAFINDSGYARPELWPEATKNWLSGQRHNAPLHWRQNPAGSWYQLTEYGPADLVASAPVYGINWFEASAFARWAGARLPHEYEWEAASRQKLLEDIGEVWEWCGNCFHPYPGFRPYPYDGYSAPYFDDRHYTLKGGSWHTRDEIKRPSFRNYYQADKRHMFAGLRLAFSNQEYGYQGDECR